MAGGLEVIPAVLQLLKEQAQIRLQESRLTAGQPQPARTLTAHAAGAAQVQAQGGKGFAPGLDAVVRALGIQHQHIAGLQFHPLAVRFDPAAALKDIQQLGKDVTVNIAAGRKRAVVDAGVQQLGRGQLAGLLGLDIEVMGDHGPGLAPSRGKPDQPPPSRLAADGNKASVYLKYAG